MRGHVLDKRPRSHRINAKEICNLGTGPMCAPHPTQQFSHTLDRLAAY
jgi:hypothetical protein